MIDNCVYLVIVLFFDFITRGFKESRADQKDRKEMFEKQTKNQETQTVVTSGSSETKNQETQTVVTSGPPQTKNQETQTVVTSGSSETKNQETQTVITFNGAARFQPGSGPSNGTAHRFQPRSGNFNRPVRFQSELGRRMAQDPKDPTTVLYNNIRIRKNAEATKKFLDSILPNDKTHMKKNAEATKTFVEEINNLPIDKKNFERKHKRILIKETDKILASKEKQKKRRSNKKKGLNN